MSLGPFFSPGSAIASIVVSSQGGILDESSITLVTGLSFRPGTVATSGTNVLGNVFGSDLTITLGMPASEFSVQTIGSQASGSFGTITVAACDGGSPLGTASSGPDVIGDSSAPEDELVSDEGQIPGALVAYNYGEASLATSWLEAAEETVRAMVGPRVRNS